jgi:hypothetical protein
MRYLVTIWTSVHVEAKDAEEAKEIGFDQFVNGEIKNRDFFTDAESSPE